jgi:alkaline phosphatase
MKAGIVTSAFLQDATPAVFYAHSSSRTNHYSIGVQLAESGFEYFAGGGFRNPAGRDKKERSLVGVAASKGYRVTSTREGFESLTPGGKTIAISPRTSSGYMPWAIDASASDISLAEFVKKGVELLDGESGFFMMVEGGKIDLACHANDAASAIREVIAFDEAVSAALDFYYTHPDDTLIVVTSDHETGGMRLGATPDKSAWFYGEMSRQKNSYAVFEGKISPRSGASLDEYLSKAIDFFGGAVMATAPVQNAFRASMTAKKSRPSTSAEYKKLYGPYDPFTIACMREMNAHAGVLWSTFYHTGKTVPVSAIGAGAEVFAGEYENSEIFAKIESLMPAEKAGAGKIAPAR